MREMKVLITGANGFVGSNLVRHISKLEGYKLACPSHSEMDIADLGRVKSVIESYKPDVVVNLAAHRNANTAEEQRNKKDGSAWMSNVAGAENLAEVTGMLAIQLIHLSSEMVYGGQVDNKGPYPENATTEGDKDKLTWYGWTKKLGEDAVLPHGTVVRIGNVTQPIYHPSLDYIGKFLWLFDAGKKQAIFSDQQVTLTDMKALTRTILVIMSKGLHGIFHVSSNDLITPLVLTEYLLQQARPSKRYDVISGSIDSYLIQHPNRYPKFGGLSSTATQAITGLIYKNSQSLVDNFVNNAA